MNLNATWSISLESYHPYVHPQKVSKNPQKYCVHSSLPKNATKNRFGSLGPLGVSMVTTIADLGMLAQRFEPPPNQ
jgi:hypothetical protein